MKPRSRLPFRPTLLLISVLALSACGPAVPVVSANNVVVLPQASPSPTPTPSELPAPVQATQTVPAAVPVQARLAVLEARARLLRSGGVPTELQQAQSADIQPEDKIEVISIEGQSQQSYSIFYLPNVVNVELFAHTKVGLTEVKTGAQNSTELTLDLEGGHVFVHLNEETLAQVTVRTAYATITSLTNGAEFDVCQTEQLTCILVKRGIVEIAAKDRREIIRAGSAGVVWKDEPLSPVSCAPVPKFIAWEARYRELLNAPALDEEIAALPPGPCPVGANGLPLHARILYRDEFSQDSRGWAQGETEHVMVRYVRYAGARYYQVEVQGPEAQNYAFVPNHHEYGDVSIEIKARTEAMDSGDFRYGVVFRRSGDQYYAFIVSPTSKDWYFLKSSPTGLEFLKYGRYEPMRGLEGQDTVRIETYGSTFLAFINGRFVDWVHESAYAAGEVGLFVDSIDSQDALVSFNSIVIWDVPAPALPIQGENCFNAMDDDGDGRIDQLDSNCQSSELGASLLLTPSSTAVPTRTPRVMNTPTAPPQATNPPASTPTNRPPATQPPLPTLSLPTIVVPLPTISLPTIVVPLPTISIPLPTISLPLPTLGLPLPGGTPRP